MKIYPYYSWHNGINSYLIGNDEVKKALVIDPVIITQSMIDHIEKNEYRLTAVCITHNCLPYGLKTLLKIYKPNIYAADSTLINNNGRVLHGDCTLILAGLTVECFSVPGYSPDSYLFKIQNNIFTGNSLTAGIIGETLHSSAEKNLRNNLSKKLFSQADSAILFPAKGPPSTVCIERTFNTLMRTYTENTIFYK